MPNYTDDVQTNGKFITGSFGSNGEIDFNSIQSSEFSSKYLSIIDDHGILKILETIIVHIEHRNPVIKSLLEIDSSTGNVGIGVSNPQAKLDVDGTINASQDVYVGGQDCAEDFEISLAEKVDPGTVMVLNDDGKLVQSKHPYDKRVAGVISGSGDLKPGLVLGRQPGHVDRVPLALMGLVNCKVDAEYDRVEVGDLLTTSENQGML